MARLFAQDGLTIREELPDPEHGDELELTAGSRI